jgi:hypothetical protein
MSNPTLLLTAPLLKGGSGQIAPPSLSVFSSSAVQHAFQTLQTDFKSDVPSGAKPTHASVGALEDDLDAIRAGTLSGTAAEAKIQADQAAILSSMGLSQTQITQIQSDQQVLQTAITTASTATSTSTGSGTSTSTVSVGTASATAATSSFSDSISAVQSPFQTLQTDLRTDTPIGSMISHAAVGTVQDDVTAIRNGTLTGTAAVTQVQTDAAAVFTSMGLTAAQVSQIQSDQQAVAAAIAADPNHPASTSSSLTTQTTLQAVSAYLVGLPGVSSFGTRGLSVFGMGGPAWGPRGGFMGWR